MINKILSMSSIYNDEPSDEQNKIRTTTSPSGLHEKVEAAYREAEFSPQVTPKQAIAVKFEEQYATNPALKAKIRRRINAIWRFFTPTVDDFIVYEATDIGSDFVGNESFRTYKQGYYDLPKFQYTKDQFTGLPTSTKIARKERHYEIKYSPETITQILESGDSSQVKLYLNDGQRTFMIYDLDSFINLSGDQLIESLYRMRMNATARGDDIAAGTEGMMARGTAWERSGTTMPQPHARQTRGVNTRAGVRPRPTQSAAAFDEQETFIRNSFVEANNQTPQFPITSEGRIAGTVEHDQLSYENAQAAATARMEAYKRKLAQDQQRLNRGAEGESDNNNMSEQTEQGKQNQPQQGQQQPKQDSPNSKLTVKETVYSDVKPDPKAAKAKEKEEEPEQPKRKAKKGGNKAKALESVEAIEEADNNNDNEGQQ